MTSKATYQAELVSAASVFIFDAQADCAMLTLTLYEIFLTFDREVRLVWQRKFNGATLLFLLNRYVSLLRLSVVIFAVLLFSDQTCSYGPFLVAGLEYSLLLIIAVFFALRVYALTQHSIIPALVVFALLVVPVVVNVYIAPLTTTRTLPPPLFCITSIHIDPKLYERLAVMTRTCVLLGDVLVLFITWHSTYRMWRDGRTARFRASLSTLLLRDGTIYFIVILILSALQLLFLFVNDVRNIETTFADTLMPLLISRLILNLREFDSAGNSTSLASADGEKTVTVMFASAPGTDSDSDSDSGVFMKSEFESSSFAAFVDPLGAPVDYDASWDDLGEDATTPSNDPDSDGAEGFLTVGTAVSTALFKAQLFAQDRCEAEDRC